MTNNIPPIVKDYLRYRKLAETGKTVTTRMRNRNLANVTISNMYASAAKIAIELDCAQQIELAKIYGIPATRRP